MGPFIPRPRWNRCIATSVEEGQLQTFLSGAAHTRLRPWASKSISCNVAVRDTGDCAMPDVIPSKLARAKLSEKDAWQRYAEAKDDSWREAFVRWQEARDASLAAWADEVSSRHR